MREDHIDFRPREPFLIIPTSGDLPLFPDSAETREGADLGARTLSEEHGRDYVVVDRQALLGRLAAAGMITFVGPDRTPRLRVGGRSAFIVLADILADEEVMKP